MTQNNFDTSAQLLAKEAPFDQKSYDEAYVFWRREWKLAIAAQNIEGLSVGVSDKFVNADEILVLRVGSEIAALALLNHLDLRLSAHHDLAYLQALPKQGREFLHSKGIQRVFVSSYNIVSLPYRGLYLGCTPISVALPGLVIGLFKRRPAFDLCMGMPLLACGNHRTLERIGMKIMHPGEIIIHNVRAKFMCVERHEINLGLYEHDIEAFIRRHGIDEPIHPVMKPIRASYAHLGDCL